MAGSENRQHQQLVEAGYCVFNNVLTDPLLTNLRQMTDSLCAAESPEIRARRLSQGSMLSAMVHPMMADIIAWQPALDCLAHLGFAKPTYTDGYIISKPGQSPRLFWHYDWFAWSYPGAYEAPPPQIFLMYYLSDTSVSRGCLRVIPGSHRKHNPLHDMLGSPHTPALSRIEDPGDPAFSTRTDEIDIPVKAGDLVIGDARLLHAAHENTAQTRRTVITLWFQPTFAGLPEEVQAQMARKTQPIPKDWPDTASEKVRLLQPHYAGDAEPCERELYHPKR
jgi:hypothetical protein